MFPNKSGGAPIYGAAAWIHYGKIFGPALGLELLARLVAGARHRHRHRCRLCAHGILPRRFPDPDLAVDHRRSRLHQGGADRCGSIPPSSWARSCCCSASPSSIAASCARPGSRRGRRGGHRAAADRRRLADPDRPCADRELDAAGAAGRRQWRRLSLQRPLGQGGLDALPRRHVPRRLVDLWLRDRGLLHQRVDNPGTDTFKAIFYLRHPLPRALHPGALHLPGRRWG